MARRVVRARVEAELRRPWLRTAAPRVRPVGFNDKQTTCGLCGREELKGTVILGYDGDDGGEFGRFGTGCAGKVMSEVNGTPARITRSDAVKWEAFRRETVLHHLDRARKAWQAGDVPGAQWEIADMRRNRNAFPHMDDELAAIAEIDASGRYRSIGRNLEPGEREEHYRRRVEEGLDEYETSLAPPRTGRLAGIRFERPATEPRNWAYAIDDEPSEDDSGRPLGAGEPVAELCWSPHSGEVNWVQTRKDRRRQGIGRDLFNWVRENHQPDLRHSDDLSDDGRAFAEAVAALRTARALLGTTRGGPR